MYKVHDTGNLGHYIKTNIRIIGMEEGEISQSEGPENTFNKIIEEMFPKERDGYKSTRSLLNAK
jgi:ribosomal protein L13